MPYRPRETSPSGLYHVIERGSGRRLLFEDDKDRRFFLDRLEKYAGQNDVGIYAWCLMVNHVHLLVKAEPDSLTSAMWGLNTSFARYFNGKNAHVGPVFQGRYKSIPIEEGVQLLETVRYIHHNPQVAGLSDYRSYKWSSFRGLLEGNGLCRADDLLAIFGGRERFLSFHENVATDQVLLEFADTDDRLRIRRSVIPDSEAIDFARRRFGNDFATAIALQPKGERDGSLRAMLAYGMSVRQVERITGIGRGVIQKCRG